MNGSVDGNVEPIPNRLFALCFSNFWFHISFCENIIKRGADNSPLKFGGSSGSFLCLFFFYTLLVFSSVKYSPCDLSWISFHELCRFALRVQKCKHLLVEKTKQIKKKFKSKFESIFNFYEINSNRNE